MFYVKWKISHFTSYYSHQVRKRSLISIKLLQICQRSTYDKNQSQQINHTLNQANSKPIIAIYWCSKKSSKNVYIYWALPFCYKYWALLLVSEKSRDTNISLNGESEKLGIAYGADWNNCHHVCSARLDWLF